MRDEAGELQKIEDEIEKTANTIADSALASAQQSASDFREQAIHLLLRAKTHRLAAETIEANLLNLLSEFNDYVNAPVAGRS